MTNNTDVRLKDSGVRKIPVESIVVEERFRKDLGDLDALAKSIDRHGLIHPIVVDTYTRKLLAGGRRLAAVKMLGWTDVPYRAIAAKTTGEALEIEQAENTDRKDFTSSERASIAEAIEREQGGTDGKVSRRTRNAVAKLAGVSEGTLGKDLTIARATKDPDPEVRKVAQGAQDEADKSGKVDKAYRKVQTVTRKRGSGMTGRRAAAPSTPVWARNASRGLRSAAERVAELSRTVPDDPGDLTDIIDATYELLDAVQQLKADLEEAVA